MKGRDEGPNIPLRGESSYQRFSAWSTGTLLVPRVDETAESDYFMDALEQ